MRKLFVLLMAVGASSPLSAESQEVDPAILDWVSLELAAFRDGPGQTADCKEGATDALRGLNQATAWYWADSVTDDEGNDVWAITSLTSTEKFRAWNAAGRTDEAWPGGDETVLALKHLGHQLANGQWRIPRSERLVLVVGHEAIHWLPGGGLNHSMEAFTKLENCFGGF